MVHVGKRLKSAREGVNREQFYALEEAVKVVKSRAKAKFDETIEIAMNLGVDPKHADQMVRGVCNLPNGSGRSQRVAVFAKGAKAAGFKVVIAGAGGAAYLPGMTAALTELPVFGVPVESKALSGVDSLYSIVQMPAGIPVGTLAIGKSGAINAALLAASVLALDDAGLAARLKAWRQQQTEAVAERPEEN